MQLIDRIISNMDDGFGSIQTENFVTDRICCHRHNNVKNTGEEFQITQIEKMRYTDRSSHKL